MTTEADRSKAQPWYVLFIKTLPWRPMVRDTGIPMLLYLLLCNNGFILAGILSAGIWGLLCAGRDWRQQQPVSVFAMLTIAIAFVEGVLFSIETSLYWGSLGVENALYGLLFFASLLLRRSVLQMMAEDSNSVRFTAAFRRTKAYRRGWQWVTAVWGSVYLLKAGFYFWLVPFFSLEMAVMIKAFLGWPRFIALLAFSYWFPHVYWRRLVENGEIDVAIIGK